MEPGRQRDRGKRVEGGDPSQIETIDFAFIFSRVLYYYSMNYEEVLQLPLTLFWELNKNISRLQAEQDLRALHTGRITGLTQETFKQTEAALRQEMGAVVIERPTLDRAALNQLKTMLI